LGCKEFCRAEKEIDRLPVESFNSRSFSLTLEHTAETQKEPIGDKKRDPAEVLGIEARAHI
jgi:hypothetical protein